MKGVVNEKRPLKFSFCSSISFQKFNSRLGFEIPSNLEVFKGLPKKENPIGEN